MTNASNSNQDYATDELIYFCGCCRTDNLPGRLYICPNCGHASISVLHRARQRYVCLPDLGDEYGQPFLADKRPSRFRGLILGPFVTQEAADLVEAHFGHFALLENPVMEAERCVRSFDELAYRFLVILD